MDTKKLFTFFAEKVNPKLKNARLLAGLNQPKGPIHFLVKHVSPATKTAKEQRKQTILRFSLEGISFIDWPSEKVDDKKAGDDFAAAKTYEWPRIVRFDYYAALREFQFDYDENTTTDSRGRKKYPKLRFYTTEGDDIQKHLTKIMDVLTGKEKNDGSYSASSSRHSASISASTDTKDRSASVSEEKAAKKKEKKRDSGSVNKERLDSSASQDEAKPKKEKKPKKIVVETAENPAPVEAEQEIQPAEKDSAPKDKSEKKKKSKAMDEVAGEKAVEEEMPAQKEEQVEPKPEPEPEPEQKKSKKDKKKNKSSSPDEAAEDPAPVADESAAKPEPEPEPEKKHKKKDKKKSEE